MSEQDILSTITTEKSYLCLESIKLLLVVIQGQRVANEEI